MKLDAQRLVGVLKRPSSLLILAGLLGLGLIFLSDGMDRTSDTAQAPAASVQIQAYEAQMERRLTDLIERMDGAGQAQVMVTLEAAGETVYALDERISQDGQHPERTRSGRRAARHPRNAAANSAGGSGALPRGR